MSKQLTALFLSSRCLSCSSAIDALVSKLPMDGIMSLPDGMTIRPHTDWVEKDWRPGGIQKGSLPLIGPNDHNPFNEMAKIAQLVERGGPRA